MLWDACRASPHWRSDFGGLCTLEKLQCVYVRIASSLWTRSDYYVQQMHQGCSGTDFLFLSIVVPSFLFF